MAPPAERPATKTRRGSIVEWRRRADELADDRGDRRGLARAACLVLSLKPVPAALGVLAAVLLGIDRDEAMAVGCLVHPRRCGEARSVLGASVQHAHERNGGSGLDVRRRVDQRAPRPPSHRSRRLLHSRGGSGGCGLGATARGVKRAARSAGLWALARLVGWPLDSMRTAPASRLFSSAHYIKRALEKSIRSEASLP